MFVTLNRKLVRVVSLRKTFTSRGFVVTLAIFLLIGSISFCCFVLTVDSLARFWVLSIYHFHACANSQLFATFKAGHLVTSGGLPSIQVGSSAQWAERVSSCAHVHLSSTSTVTSTHACTLVLNLFNLYNHHPTFLCTLPRKGSCR